MNVLSKNDINSKLTFGESESILLHAENKTKIPRNMPKNDVP